MNEPLNMVASVKQLRGDMGTNEARGTGDLLGELGPAMSQRQSPLTCTTYEDDGGGGHDRNVARGRGMKMAHVCEEGLLIWLLKVARRSSESRP